MLEEVDGVFCSTETISANERAGTLLMRLAVVLTSDSIGVDWAGIGLRNCYLACFQLPNSHFIMQATDDSKTIHEVLECRQPDLSTGHGDTQHYI